MRQNLKYINEGYIMKLKKVALPKLSSIVDKLNSVKAYPTKIDFYEESSTWYSEVYESVKCSRDLYRLITIILSILLGLSIFGIVSILPLKQYYYRLITLDKLTGEVAVVKEMENRFLEESWVTTRYFINQYIQNRHTYSYEDITRRFNLVLAMSNQILADEYKNEIVDTNAKSPIKELGKHFYREVSDVTINKLNQNTALVRFKVITRNRTNLNDIKTENYQAVVKWEYKNINMDFKDRDKNPFGFFVTYYQKSPVFAES
jgi:type IV secretory pathway component VirB8